MRRYFCNFILYTLLMIINSVSPRTLTSPLPIFYYYNDSTTAAQYKELANTSLKNEKFDSSLFYLAKASKIYESIKKWENLTECLNMSGDVLRIMGKFSDAETYLEEAERIVQNKLHKKNSLLFANINYSFGILRDKQGKYSDALVYHQKALNLKIKILGRVHRDVAKSYNGIGIVYQNMNQTDNSIEALLKGIDSAPATNEKNLSVLSDLYNSLAITYIQKSDILTASEYYKKVLRMRISIYGHDHSDVAKVNINIGNIHAHLQEYSRALEYYQNAMPIIEKNYGNSHPLLADILHNITYCHNKMNNLEAAILSGKKSLEILLSIHGEEHPYIASSYLGIGNSYTRLGKDDLALEYYQKSLMLNKKLVGENNATTSIGYRNIGAVYYKKKMYHKAAELFHQAALVLLPKSNANDLYKKLNIQHAISPQDLLLAFDYKAEALDLAYDQTQDISILYGALNSYDVTREIIAQMKFSYRSEESKLQITEHEHVLRGRTIAVLLKLYRITSDEKFKSKAWFVAEQGAVSVLREIIDESNALRFVNIPDSLKKNEQELSNKLVKVDIAIQSEHAKGDSVDNLQLTNLQNEYFATNENYRKLLEYFDQSYPDYFSLRHKPLIISIKSLQKTLDDQTTILQYFISDNLLYVFPVSQKQFDCITIPIDSTFETTINTFSKSIKQIEYQEFVESSLALYKIIIAPIQQKVNLTQNLVIIPDGILYKVPFEALVVEKQHSLNYSDYSQLNYLIKKHNISYHYSAELFKERINKKFTTQIDGFVGFAPVFGNVFHDDLASKHKPNIPRKLDSLAINRIFNNELSRFKPLKYSKDEIEQISLIFQNQGKRTRKYLYSHASETQFKNSIADFRYVHVATHGVFNNSFPELSGLVFAQNGDQPDDGVLYAGEMYQLMLHANLVVLSSCESGVGRLIRGEGLMALTRGLIYSGATNILVSLWTVGDKHAKNIMINFYNEFLHGGTYSSALRQVKLDIINNKATAAPRIWSSFILIGQ